MKKILLTVFLVLFSSYAFAGMNETSGVTAGTIADRARYDLNALSASGVTDDAYTDTELYQWIDEAVRIIVNKTGCLESGVSNIILVENVRRYSIESGTSHQSVEAVEYDMGVSGNTVSNPQIYGLERVQRRDIGHYKKIGAPKVYLVWNNNIEINPIPRSEHSGNALYVYFINLPNGVSTATSPIETPAPLDIAIPYYVKAKGLYKFEQNASGDKHMAIFKAIVDEYLIRVQRRQPIK